MPPVAPTQAIENAEEALRKVRGEILGAIETMRVNALVRATDELETAVRDHRLDDAVRLQRQIENLIQAIKSRAPYDPDGPVTMSGKPRK